ncbi:MAG: hypothetical protein A2087_04915 [Spirochaetes bacterium GWD1_61_31]|nr:MAG: hypothetical protein A2Y37_01545 [Spirochaetes bacterium GWB1_60_80]OHD34899.1 MAG: hypothetical protein A2004_00575 [Spirochaetes bacterium GWC1_61_12]OHD37072.1 MAG: hypothetical protein A2087_04915 [Spirochaetes bacterium GWD1_61_31]OHD44663.1 MAG: hypothetical protein A2Y35_11885 [Spirochaetes bacterium GWE1_60_18]OHD61070.1 MAG: hypothetical protein A2Y32_09160 [Spirochaetes bacterium GWF1_60_12]HAP42730.1 hypothetical protein [Spirochaetaceae bacterium]
MNNKRIFGLALLLVACTLALPAADFGLQLLNVSAFSTELPAPETEWSLNQLDRAVLWLSTPLSAELSLYVSGFYEFSASLLADPAISPYRFDAGMIALNGLFPRLLGENSTVAFSLGRIPVQDFSARVLSGLNDGALVSLTLGNNQIKLLGGYLGLQEKVTALVMIDTDDQNRLSGDDKAAATDPDFPSSYFALPRLFFGAGFRASEIFPSHDAGIELWGQLDLLAGGAETTHTFYAEPYIAGRLGRLLRWNAWQVTEMIVDDVVSVAMAAGGRLRLAVPEVAALNLNLNVQWSGGLFAGGLDAFTPIRQSMMGSYSAFFFQNSLMTGLDASLTPLEGFSVAANGALYLRGSSELPADFTGSSLLTGFEGGFNLRYRPTGDLSLSLGGGIFVPNTVDGYPTDTLPSLKATFGLALDL